MWQTFAYTTLKLKGEMKAVILDLRAKVLRFTFKLEQEKIVIKILSQSYLLLFNLALPWLTLALI